MTAWTRRLNKRQRKRQPNGIINSTNDLPRVFCGFFQISYDSFSFFCVLSEYRNSFFPLHSSLYLFLSRRNASMNNETNKFLRKEKNRKRTCIRNNPILNGYVCVICRLLYSMKRKSCALLSTHWIQKITIFKVMDWSQLFSRFNCFCGEFPILYWKKPYFFVHFRWLLSIFGTHKHIFYYQLPNYITIRFDFYLPLNVTLNLCLK